MALKKSTKSHLTPLFNAEDISSMAKEYAEISKKIKELEERKKSLADKIKNGAEQYGVKDDKGSFYYESDSFIMGKVASKSIKINQEKATETLESLGLGDVVDVITTKEVNEDRLQEALQDGRISIETVEGFTDVTVRYSVSVKEKEEMAEVGVSSLKAAKRK